MEQDVIHVPIIAWYVVIIIIIKMDPFAGNVRKDTNLMIEENVN